MNIKINEKESIDLQKLIKSKLLIQANSGGGKSWLIRRILEQSHGKVQQIILDTEGEFATLREKYDYILIGKNADAPAEVRSAALLARKLLELGVSAIIDLYELHPQDRKRFVRLFLDSMVNAPKELWHPVLVIIDEAHTFVPEKGESEAANAVIGLCSLGRKRQFGVILATQRISKLHKDAAAECNNKLIGRTGLDIDRKRSGEELGFTGKEEFLSLRTLKPGEFYAFGPAISDEVIKVTVGKVETSHEQTGKMSLKVAPPTDAMKKVLGKLADLPKEAEKEASTVAELKQEILKLKRSTNVVQADPKILKEMEAKYKENIAFVEKQFNDNVRFTNALVKDLEEIGKIAARVQRIKAPTIRKIPMRYSDTKDRPVVKELFIASPGLKIPSQREINKEFLPDQESRPLRQGAMKMLNWIAAANPQPISRNRVATLAGFSVSGGTFNTYISELKRANWIFGDGENLMCTTEGLKNAEPIEIPTGQELVNLWKSKFREGAAKMLEYLYQGEEVGAEITKQMLAEATGFEVTGGTFNTYISELRRNSLIKVEGDIIRISSEFFA